jgi:hypothetical protein
MNQSRRKTLAYKYGPVLLMILLLIGFNGYAQTYNPSAHVVVNDAISPAQATPVDSRSMFYDATNFVYRPYQSVSEVRSYLNLSKYRVGGFLIIVDSGGILQPGGFFTGGVNNYFIFKDGTADANLVETNLFGSSGACATCFQIPNNLSEGVPSTMRTNLGLGSMSTQSTTASSTDLSGTWPSGLTVNSVQGANLANLRNYLNLTNTPAIPPQLNLSTLGLISQSGVYPNLTITGNTPTFEQTLLKLNTTSQVDSINTGAFVFRIFGTSAVGIPGGTTAQRPGSPSFGDTRANTDSTGSPLETWNGSAWVHPSGGGGGGGSGITALTGDGTASGTGSVPFTLATVNTNVFGSNTALKVTVNGKGLITAAVAMSASDIKSILGYTPYDSLNPKGYISLTSLSASSPLSYNNGTGAFSIQVANTSQNGYLSSTDWNTFNGKLSNALSSGNIFVGNASNIATGQTMTGDVGINNTGVSTIQTNAVTTSKINGNAVTYAKIQLSTQQALLGAPAAGAYQEIQLGTNLSITGGVLNASTAGAQTLVYTQNATNNNLAITGGNSVNFLIATATKAGLVDSAHYHFLDSLYLGLKIFNLYAGNLMTATGLDTLNAGGNALNNTTFAMGAFSLSITGLPNKSTPLSTDSILMETAPGQMYKIPFITGGITQLTGDVTAGPGSGSQVATISALAVTTGKLAANAVTLGKMSTNASSTLLGYDVSGNAQDVALGTNLSLVSGVLNATGGGGNVTRNYLSDSIFQSAVFRYRDTTLGIKYQQDYAVSPMFVDSLRVLGLRAGYDSSNWVTIGSGSYLQTNSGYSVVGGKLVATGSLSYPNYIRLPNPTKLDNWTIQMDYKITSLVTTDSGFKIRMVTINPAVTANLEAYLNTATGANFGKIALNSIQAGTGSFEQYSSTAMPTILANDSISVTLYYNFGTVIVTATDWTQLTTVSASFTNTFTSGTTYAVTNIGQVTLSPGPSTYQIDRIKYSSNQPYAPNMLVIGYSITDGFFAGSLLADWARAIGAGVNAGTGDQTGQMIQKYAEIIAQKPKSVLIGGLAGNDIAAGISSAVWQANLTGIYDTLTAHGIAVYFTLESPRNSVDITAANTYIKAQWPGRWIDIYTPLWSGSGTGLNAAYSVDGTHWNAAGHLLVTNVVDTSAQYLSVATGNSNLGIVQYYASPTYTNKDSTTLVDLRNMVKYVGSHSGTGGVTQGGSRNDGFLMMQSGANRIITSLIKTDSTGSSPTITFGNTIGFKFIENYAGSGDIPAGSAFFGSTTKVLALFPDNTSGGTNAAVMLTSLDNGGVHSWAEKFNTASGFGVARFNKEGGFAQFNVLSNAPNGDAILELGAGNLTPNINNTDSLGTFNHQFAGLFCGFAKFTAALGVGTAPVNTSFFSLHGATTGASVINIGIGVTPTTLNQGDIWATLNNLNYFDATAGTVNLLSNFYIRDGTLSGNRTVTMSGNSLTFTGGPISMAGNAYNNSLGSSLLLNSSTIGNSVTAASGTVTDFANMSLSGGSLTATNTGVVYTNASTLYLVGAPSASTNVTITNPFALKVAAGAVTFNSGQFLITGASNWNPGANIPGSRISIAPGTLTDNVTAASTVVPNAFVFGISNSVLAATNTAVTYTNASTLYVNGPPSSGTNTTLTNAWSLQVGGGNSLFQGDIYSAHYLDNSSTPGIAAGTGAGTSPTVSITGTDQSGKITVTTGTAPTLSGVIATITYASGFSFRTGTYPILFPGNAATALLSGTSMVFTTGAQTNFTLTAGTVALTGATSYVWYYKIGGN